MIQLRPQTLLVQPRFKDKSDKMYSSSKAEFLGITNVTCTATVQQLNFTHSSLQTTIKKGIVEIIYSDSQTRLKVSSCSAAFHLKLAKYCTCMQTQKILTVLEIITGYSFSGGNCYSLGTCGTVKSQWETHLFPSALEGFSGVKSAAKPESNNVRLFAASYTIILRLKRWSRLI